MRTRLEEILACHEFKKLKDIGGHKIHHLEGSAYIHTMAVLKEAKTMFPDQPLMWRVAALHDIGKIYTGICHGPEDWEYPDHSIAGSLKGILAKFISLEDEDFEKIQWYIRNHVKPLFWTEGNFNPNIGFKPDGCSVRNLARLAVCDLQGSLSIEDQSKQIDFLLTIS